MYKDRQFESIQIIKGLAILMVLLVHSSIFFHGLNPVIYQMTRVGRWGCQAFFVFSGFTLTLSWKSKKKPQYLPFLKRRIKRIVPYWYFAIIFYQVYAQTIGLLGGELFTKIETSPGSIFAALLLLNGLIPSCFNSVVPGGWYIGTQWILYLAFPLFIRIFDFCKGKKISVKIVPLSSLLMSFTIQGGIAIWHGDGSLSGLYSYLQYSFINQMPCFLCGMALYYLVLEKQYCKNTAVYYGVCTIISFCIASFSFYFMRNIPLIFVFVPTGYAISFCYMFLWSEQVLTKIAQNNKAKHILNFLANWGGLSYEAYYTNTIFTMIIPFYILSTKEDTNIVGFIIALLIMGVTTFLSACAVRRFYDMLRMKKRLRGGKHAE